MPDSYVSQFKMNDGRIVKIKDTEARGLIEQANTSIEQLAEDVGADFSDVRQQLTGIDTELEEFASLNLSQITGKNLVIIADSWGVGGSASTQAQRFSTRLANSLNMNEFNFSVGGAGFALGNSFISELNTANDTMTDEQKSDTSIVLIVGGVNDWRHRVDSEITVTSFVDAVNNTISRAHAIFPKALIVIGVSTTTKLGYTDTWRHWASFASRNASANKSYPVKVIQNVGNCVNGYDGNYVSDNLHLTDLGHSRFAAHIEQAILGGKTNVFYYCDAIDLEEGFAYTVIPHIFRENDEFILSDMRVTFPSAISSNTLIGTFNPTFAPKYTIYTPAYQGDRIVGCVGITTNGHVYFNSLSADVSATAAITADIHWQAASKE